MKANYNIKISGLSAVVPKEIIDNDAEAIEDVYMQKVIKMTGVHKRHITPLHKNGVKLMDYAVKAGELAIKQSGIEIEKIKFMVYVTQTPDYLGPSTALPIHKELGLTTECMAFDMNLGCTGFVAGIQVVSAMMTACDDEEVAGLVIVADALAAEPRENANDALLFGDSATAAVLTKEKNASIKVKYSSDGSRYQYICKEKGADKSYMDGDAVFQFSISEVPNYLTSFMVDNNIGDSDIDFFVSHQAQDFIIKHVTKKIKVEKSKILYSLHDYGNTSGSSIPMTICANKEVMSSNTKILAAGFGVGLAWGFLYFTIDKDAIVDVLEL